MNEGAEERLTVTWLYKSKYCSSISLVLLGGLEVVGGDVFERPLHLDVWPSGRAARDDTELQRRLTKWMPSTRGSGRCSGLTCSSSRWAWAVVQDNPKF